MTRYTRAVIVIVSAGGLGLAALDGYGQAPAGAAGGEHAKAPASKGKGKMDPKIRMLLAAAHDSSVELRRAAIQFLGKTKSPQAVEPLMALAEDPDENVRAAATNALVAIGDKRCLQVYHDALNDTRSSVTNAALQGLANLADPRSIPVIVEFLACKPPHDAGRRGAHDALAKFGDASVDDLVMCIRKRPYVSSTAAVTLAKIGTKRARAGLAELAGDKNWRIRWIALRAIRHLPQPPIDTLSVAIKDTSIVVRKDAIEQLAGQVKTREAFDALAAALSDSHPEAQQGAAWALHKLRDKRLIAPFAELLNSPNASTRQYAVKFLNLNADAASRPARARAIATPPTQGQSSEEKETPPLPLRVKALLETARGNDVRLRAAAIRSLVQLPRDQAVDALMTLTGDPGERVRVLAMDALATIGDRRCFDEFMNALWAPSDTVRYGAVRGLCKLADPRAAEMLANLSATMSWTNRSDVHRQVDQTLLRMEDAAVPHLAAMLRRGAWHQNKAAVLLAKMNTPLATKALTTAARGRRWRVRAVAVRSMSMAAIRPWKAIIAALDDPSPTVQLAAVSAIPDLMNGRNLSGVMPSTQKELRSAAVDALSRVLTKGHSSIRRQAAKSLAGIRDPRLIVPFCTLLKKGDPFERREAIGALWYIADNTATTALVVASDDPDKTIRRQAQTILVRIGGAEALPGLIRAARELSHTSGRSATTCVEAIAKINTPQAAAALVELLGEAPEGIQSRAMRALFETSHPEAAKLIAGVATNHATPRLRKEAVSLLGYRLMSRATHALCLETFTAVIAKDADSTVRGAAIEYGRRLPGSAGLKVCLPALQDPDSSVRGAGAKAIAELDLSEGWLALRAAAGKESDRRVLSIMGQIFAARSKTTRYGYEGMMVVLQRELALRKDAQGADSPGGSSVVVSLGRTKDTRATKILCEILATDPSESWRDQAVEALAAMKGATSIDAIIKALGDESRKVSQRATLMLTFVANQGHVQALAEAAKNPKARQGAARILAILDPKLALKPYIAALESNAWDHAADDLATVLERSGKADIVEALIVALKQGPLRVRVLAARRLSQTRDRRALAPLREAMESKEPSLRGTAESALKTIERHYAPVRRR